MVAPLWGRVRRWWSEGVRLSPGGAGARPGSPQAGTFKEHVSMTSACPQRVRFRNRPAIQSGTRGFSPGDQTFPWSVCVSPPPPLPPTPHSHSRCRRKSHGGRARRGAPACPWQPRILEEVGACPTYFSCRAPPLGSEAARAGTVQFGVAVKNERGSLVFSGCQEGSPFFSIGWLFLNQTHPSPAPGRKAQRESPRALGW